jgi:ATP-dependent Clp protease protease subunit
MGITIQRFKKEHTSFTAKAEADALTLEIYDAIGADWFGQGITASEISDAMKTAGDYSSLNVRLNSPGGDLFEGVTIYNLFRASGKPVNVTVDGLAASAASLIAMAGDTITMGVGTQMMIHRAMGGAMGYAEDMRELADILDSVSAGAADIYVVRTGMEKDKVMQLMTAETWMSASEALESGFATAVSESQPQNVSGRFDLSMFKNTPVSLQTEPVESKEDPLINIFRKKLALLRK